MGAASRELAETAEELGTQQGEKTPHAVEQGAEKPAAPPRAQPQPQPQLQNQHPGPTAAEPAKKGAW